jgi:hypothetical protein
MVQVAGTGRVSPGRRVSPSVYVTNTAGSITLKGVDATAAGGVLLKAAAGDWGTSGSNGGTATLAADGETLVGDLVTDAISSIAATLANGTTLTGTIDTAALALDGTSTWTVTGSSHLTTLDDQAGIAGNTITNIVGNGNSVTYDATLAANGYLGGATYTLSGGGTLTPAT